MIGHDINKKRINELKNGIDITKEIEKEILLSKIQLTNNPKDLKSASIHIVTVPTPVNEYKKPDLQPLINATETIGRAIKDGDIVIYESTV